MILLWNKSNWTIRVHKILVADMHVLGLIMPLRNGITASGVQMEPV